MIEIAVIGIHVVEASAVEISVIEVGVAKVVAVDDRVTVRDVGVVIENYSMAMPVRIPVAPAPTKSSEEADSESNAEGNGGTLEKDSGYWIPARVSHDWCTVHQPRIEGRHVHHFRVRRFNDNRVALSAYLFLFVAI